MPVQGSLNLADVTMSCQPVQVQDDELHPSLLSPEKPSVTVPELSPAFQEIINRLVQQHLVEMSRMDGVLQLRQAQKSRPSYKQNQLSIFINYITVLERSFRIGFNYQLDQFMIGLGQTSHGLCSAVIFKQIWSMFFIASTLVVGTC